MLNKVDLYAMHSHIKSQTGNAPEALQIIYMTTVSVEECAKRLPVDDHQLCARTPYGQGVCQVSRKCKENAVYFD